MKLFAFGHCSGKAGEYPNRWQEYGMKEGLRILQVEGEIRQSVTSNWVLVLAE